MKLQMTICSLAVVAALAAAGCHTHKQHNLPPAQMLMHPGPGVDGPGPGVMICGGAAPPMAAFVGAGQGATSQFAFIGPDGMEVRWDVSGVSQFDSEPLVAPGRQNFGQMAIYRLKLTNIPGRPGVELYPTLEVGPATPRTDAYLAHNAIPIQLTEEDLDQVLSGNYVTKVIYLPDPEFQELALAGVETLVSTRLDPGVDPIVEADRRGAILAIFRVGNKDLEVPGADGEMAAGGDVVPTSYNSGAGMPCPMGVIPGGEGGMGGPMGAPTDGFQPGAMPPNHVAGVTGPQWGMPMSGTPIGLPGPPHIPLGVPAGLQRHVVKNHTRHHLPEPVKSFKIDVKQHPGYSYPKPVDRVRIHENTFAPQAPVLHQGQYHKTVVDPNCVE
jgi:hypothetical protein